MNGAPDYYQGLRPEMKAYLPDRYEKVLEIGCGFGNFKRNLDKPHEYWGIEPVEVVAKAAVETLDRVLIGTYEQVSNELPDGYFDLVICNDVVEHMTDHDEFFFQIKRKIKSGGYLVASIPNVRYAGNLRELLVEKDWEYKDAGVLDRTHLRFFTEKSLHRCLALHGFRVERFAGINNYRGYRGRFGLNRLFYWCSLLLLGGDIKYLQFAVRARV